jgi:hypothetical protein
MRATAWRLGAFVLFEEKAYLTLDAIAEGAGSLGPEHEAWIKAFKEIRWVVQTSAGLALTPDGRQARDEMAAKQLAGEAPEPGTTPRRNAGS